MKEKDTPLRLVRSCEKRFPGIFPLMDNMREAKGTAEDMDWPDYCHIPIGAAHTALVLAYGLTDREAGEVCAEITACYTWRQNKIMFDFDLDFARTLALQAYELDDFDELPTSLLTHLPYNCVYIRVPGLFQDIDGFFAWTEYDINYQRTELRVQYVLHDKKYSVPAVLHLVPNGNIGDCISSTNEEIKKHEEVWRRETGIDPEELNVLASGAEDIRMLLIAVQLLLYLCSSNADIEHTPRLQRRATSPKKQKEDKASDVQDAHVGVRIGSVIRRQRSQAPSVTPAEEGTGAPKRPHSRRGHWHHYWAGSERKGDRRLILKWTAPTFIHIDDSGDDIVVHKVK